MLVIGVAIIFVCELVVQGASEPPPKTGVMAAAVATDDAPTQRIEDFFWTGSGDGPAAPADARPAHPSPVSPATIVRTTTVLATLYLDNSQPLQPVTEQTTGECILNCEGSSGFPDSLQPGDSSIPGDQRYWLLTVVRGGTPDALQLKLARLYQKAFLRSVQTLQQERHLGIVKSLDAPSARKKHEVHSFEVRRNEVFQKPNPKKIHNIQSSMRSSPELSTRLSEVTPDLNITDSFQINITSITVSNLSMETESINKILATKVTSDHTWILATSDVALVKRDVVIEQGDVDDEGAEKLIDIPFEEESNETNAVFKREIIKPEQQPPVQVYIQNVTESPDTMSVEIVYVVLVGGRAVPAAVAARDMRLVRDAEVASELGFPVTTKAEPYLKAAEGLEGEGGGGIRGTELWAMVGGAAAAGVLLLLLLLALLCRLARRKKSLPSSVLSGYRSEMLKEAHRNQLKQVHEEKDGRLISVVSPSRTRPSSCALPAYRGDTSPSSSSSSGVSEVAAALRRRQRGHGVRLPHRRVGATDSLLASAGLSESSSADSARAPSGLATPTSYLSMPSVKSFPRGNTVEPLTRVLEPVSVRHLDIDTPVQTPKRQPELPPKKPQRTVMEPEPGSRRQMTSQLVRLGSMDRDPGVVGPLVWDLHCQRIKGVSKPAPRAKDSGNVSRMRQRFNELVDDAFSLFGSPASSPSGRQRSDRTYSVEETGKPPSQEDHGDSISIAQARNDNVKLPNSPYTAFDTIRGVSASIRPTTSVTFSQQATLEAGRPRTSLPKHPVPDRRLPPARAWDTSNPQIREHSAVARQPTVNRVAVLAEGRLPAGDPALPLISAIKSEIQRVRDANIMH